MKKIHETLASGKADQQACYNFLCWDSLRLACIGLILNRGDDEAIENFREAARYALDWLRAPGSVGGPRVYDVNLSVSESGVTPTSIHEKPPSREPRKLSISDFSMIAIVTAAFGEKSTLSEVGRFPEDSCRNPDVIELPEAYGQMRALKAWMRGEEVEAKLEAQAVLALSKAPVIQSGVGALLALANGDSEGFHGHLEARLVQYKKQFLRTPNDPLGVVCLHGMALCRLAIERGMEVEEGPYLPLRFLPNWRAADRAAVH